jgi:hypothetical protein
VQDAVNNDEPPLAINNHEPDAVNNDEQDDVDNTMGDNTIVSSFPFVIRCALAPCCQVCFRCLCHLACGVEYFVSGAFA